MENISLLNIENPDSASMVNKTEIDITVSTFDISASGYFQKIKTNYTNTEINVTIPAENYINSSSYYVPIYIEKLDYDTWLTTINRNFQELT